LYHKLKRTSRVIKTVLLDQTVLAGLGNIYVDETLFKAGVHPLKKANKLTKKEVNAIRSQAIETLAEACRQGGTTIRSYVMDKGRWACFNKNYMFMDKKMSHVKSVGSQL